MYKFSLYVCDSVVIYLYVSKKKPMAKNLIGTICLSTFLLKWVSASMAETMCQMKEHLFAFVDFVKHKRQTAVHSKLLERLFDKNFLTQKSLKYCFFDCDIT